MRAELADLVREHRARDHAEREQGKAGQQEAVRGAIERVERRQAGQPELLSCAGVAPELDRRGPRRLPAGTAPTPSTLAAMCSSQQAARERQLLLNVASNELRADQERERQRSHERAHRVQARAPVQHQERDDGHERAEAEREMQRLDRTDVRQQAGVTRASRAGPRPPRADARPTARAGRALSA